MIDMYRFLFIEFIDQSQSKTENIMLILTAIKRVVEMDVQMVNESTFQE